VARGNRNAAVNLAGLHERRGVVSGPSPVTAIAAAAVGRGVPTFQVSSAEDVLIGMATLEHEQGRPERAERILRQVVATRSRARGLAALTLGILREARGDREGARWAYAEALASDDRSAAGAAGLNLALVSAAAGDHREAERLLRIAAESTHPEARVSGALKLGAALALRGAHAEARPWFERVVESGHPEYGPVAEARLGEGLETLVHDQSSREQCNPALAAVLRRRPARIRQGCELSRSGEV
jgi:tetratricopeptide (TPR) repeat protein